MQKTNTKKSNAGAIIASLAGITAAAIGSYYLYGHKNAEKNRAKIKSWMFKAKGDVLEEFEKVEDVTESTYMKVVDTVLKKYNELKTINPEELEAFLEEMRGHWEGIKETMQSRPMTKSVIKPIAKPKIHSKTTKKKAKK